MLKYLILSVLPVLCAADPLSVPSATGYYTESAFTQAVAQYAPTGTATLTDSFNGGQSGAAGFSVTSAVDFDGDQSAGTGHFAAGAYSETTEKYSETVWSFNQPIYAFGGTWNLPSINAGLQVIAGGQVYFMPDGIVQPWSSYGQNSPQLPAAGWSGFWGFVSSAPVTEVIVSSGDEGFPGSFGQSYAFSDMKTACLIPEPSCLWLVGAGGLLVLLGLSRRANAKGAAD